MISGGGLTNEFDHLLIPWQAMRMLYPLFTSNKGAEYLFYFFVCGTYAVKQ
jgi:hypothetical protein